MSCTAGCAALESSLGCGGSRLRSGWPPVKVSGWGCQESVRCQESSGLNASRQLSDVSGTVAMVLDRAAATATTDGYHEAPAAGVLHGDRTVGDHVDPILPHRPRQRRCSSPPSRPRCPRRHSVVEAPRALAEYAVGPRNCVGSSTSRSPGTPISTIASTTRRCSPPLTRPLDTARCGRSSGKSQAPRRRARRGLLAARPAPSRRLSRTRRSANTGRWVGARTTWRCRRRRRRGHARGRQAHDRPQGARTAAVVSDEGDDLSPPNVQAGATDHTLPSVPHVEIVDAQQHVGTASRPRRDCRLQQLELEQLSGRWDLRCISTTRTISFLVRGLGGAVMADLRLRVRWTPFPGRSDRHG